MMPWRSRCFAQNSHRCALSGEVLDEEMAKRLKESNPEARDESFERLVVDGSPAKKKNWAHSELLSF